MTITITVRKTGSLFITADDAPNVRLVDHEGNEIPKPPEGKPLSLCRCGASSRKPFCDGTHSKIGFLAGEFAQEIVANALPSPTAEVAAPATDIKT
jgi:CDGSH-type Zn-finger protein